MTFKNILGIRNFCISTFSIKNFKLIPMFTLSTIETLRRGYYQLSWLNFNIKFPILFTKKVKKQIYQIGYYIKNPDIEESLYYFNCYFTSNFKLILEDEMPDDLGFAPSYTFTIPKHSEYLIVSFSKYQPHKGGVRVKVHGYILNSRVHESSLPIDMFIPLKGILNAKYYIEID